MLGFYVYQFVPIMLLEAFVLWRMKFAGIRMSLLDSLMLNFASFVVLLLGLGPYIAGIGPWGLTLFCTYSTMIEGAFLMLLESEHHSPKKIWLTVFVANLVSCIMLGIETLFVTPTKG
ncbi:MAG TPA: hypothetical protein V6C76_04130 [Drouetiella sp.]